MSEELIRHLDELAADAWPAAVTQDVDGCRLRFTSGVTRRANSALTTADSGALLLPEKFAQVEAFYRDRGLPARLQMSPASRPPELDAFLAARGYREAGRTAVQTAPLDGIDGSTGGPASDSVTVGATADSIWLDTYVRTDGCDTWQASVRRDILGRIRDTAGFALLRVEGEPAATGLAVARGEWAGFFCMATLPSHRRRGAATAVLQALAAWARKQDAAQAYLQVMDDNDGAVALYARAGFRTLYHYHYREAPAGY